MSLPILRQIGSALRNLNPSDVRGQTDRSVTFGVLASDDEVAAEIFTALIPADCTHAQVHESGRHIVRIASEADFQSCEVGLAERGVPHPAHFYRFDRMKPQESLETLLADQEEHWLPLAKTFPGLRPHVIESIIWKVSKENALFTVATALPNIVPNLGMIPWAAGEFASDTAFLTMNQVRMAFLIAAASDSDIGYKEQKGQIGSIVAAAFGWRAVAREMAGKIPAGGGLVSKGLVAFAGTYVVGKGLEQYFRIGRRMTRAERRRFYSEAMEKGRHAVEQMVLRARRTPRQASAAPSAD